MAKNNNSDKNSKKKIGANMVAFYTVCCVAVLYLVSMILGLCNISLTIIGALQGVATAFLIGIASLSAWKFVAKKGIAWKILYIVCLLIVIIGIIVPLVM